MHPIFRDNDISSKGSDVMLRDSNLRPQLSKWTNEPSLCELLSDPIAQALMAADGVKCHHLEALFANVKCATAARNRGR
jgi:hypothetical protein